VFQRAATSIVLLTAVLAGVIRPSGVCALMCERHSRAEAHHHCTQDSDSMPRMAHNHSAMHHASVGDVAFVVQAQSCQTDCAVAEQLNISRKVVPQLTVVQTNAVAPKASYKVLVPHVRGTWNLDTGPPSFPSGHTASYSILRI